MNLFQRSLPGLLLVTLGLSACQSSPDAGEDNQSVASLVRAGRFDEAVLTAQAILDQDPAHQRAQINLRDARMALLISQGRLRTFEGRTEEGLQLFYQAQAMDSTNEVVRDWINKTRIQLAEDTLTLSGTLISREELAERRDLLKRVLAYLPENEGSARVNNLRVLASSSLERVELNLAFCEARGEECFNDGMGSMAKGNLHESLRDFSTAVLFDKTQEAAVEGYGKVNVLVGEEYLAQALDYERMGLFDAARMQFERVHQKDPVNQEAIEGLNRMEREVRTSRILEQAEMSILRNTPEEAELLLSEAEQLTRTQQHLVEGLRLQIRSERWESMYQEALGQEAEGDLPRAVLSLEALLVAAGDFKDAGVRKETLEEFIARTEGLYAQAAEASDQAGEYSLLREIQILWPAYKDVAERVKALGEALEAEEAAKAPVGEAGATLPMDREQGSEPEQG